jgi:UDP-MurNAc hydroxylase
MKVRYIYSACVVIETEDTKIVCDPWFDEIFDGAWAQYPKIDDPIEAIGQVDYIYVSHVHDDHYDPSFLKRYLAKYNAQIIIGETTPNILARRMKEDGLAYIAITTFINKKTVMSVIPNTGYQDFNLDTALLVKSHGQTVVNLNDNTFDMKQLDQIVALADNKVDFALLPYTGAGSFPQNYYFEKAQELKNAQDKHNNHWKIILKQYLDVLKPKAFLPFAGKYFLAGELACLNKDRGMIDPIDVKLDHKNAVIIDDGGDAYYDLDSMKVSRERTNPYDYGKAIEIASRDVEFRYSRELKLTEDRIPLDKLLPTAVANAKMKSKFNTDYYLIIKFGENRYFSTNLNQENKEFTWTRITQEPSLEIEIDPRYLFGLITRLYLWASAHYHYKCIRKPNVYNEKVHNLLHYLYL